MLILIAQKKGFDTLNTTQKNQALWKVPFLKKIISSKLSKMVKMVKNEHYEQVFLDFFTNGTLHRAGVFALYEVHQNPSFELSKSTFQQFSDFSP